MPHVLVIDEHEDSRIIVRTIAQYGGFEVTEARHGREGLEQAARRRPDVIVLDLDLRRLPARELLAMLRSDPTLRYVPIIALSANRDELNTLATGVDALVHKPLTIPALLTELQRLGRPLDA